MTVSRFWRTNYLIANWNQNQMGIITFWGVLKRGFWQNKTIFFYLKDIFNSPKTVFRLFSPNLTPLPSFASSPQLYETEEMRQRREEFRKKLQEKAKVQRSYHGISSVYRASTHPTTTPVRRATKKNKLSPKKNLKSKTVRG